MFVQVFCFIIFITIVNSKNCSNNLSTLINLAPLLQDTNPVPVTVSITILDFEIDDTKLLHLKTTILLNQKWRDPRLGPNDITRKRASGGKVWKPVITITNGLQDSNCCNNNDDTLFWRGLGEEIISVERLQITTKCTTKFKYYPFDSQTCEINIGSYRFPDEEIELIWEESPLEMKASLNLGDFSIIKYNTTSDTEARTSGNFTVLVTSLSILRNYEHYLSCTVLPPFLVTILSRVLSWNSNINQDSTRKNALCVGTLYILLHLYEKSTCKLYGNDIIKAIDIYFLICGLFTICSTFFLKQKTNDNECRTSVNNENELENGNNFNRIMENLYTNISSELILRTCYILTFILAIILLILVIIMLSK